MILKSNFGHFLFSQGVPLRVKYQQQKHFSSKKTKHVDIFFQYKENIFKNRKLPHNEKIRAVGTILLTDLSSLSNFQYETTS